MVTVREFARQVGRDQALILRLIKKGVLPRNEDGTIPLADGLAAFQAYDTAPKNKGGRPKKGEKKQDEAPPDIEAKAPVIDAEQRQESISINTAMRKANLAEKTYKAKLRELEYKRESGELLEKSEVSEAIALAVSNFQAKIRAIPPRIASMCEGRVAREIEEIIAEAHEGAFAELKKLEKKYKDE